MRKTVDVRKSSDKLTSIMETSDRDFRSARERLHAKLKNFKKNRLGNDAIQRSGTVVKDVDPFKKYKGEDVSVEDVFTQAEDKTIVNYYISRHPDKFNNKVMLDMDE